MHAANLAETDFARQIIDRLFTASNSQGINYQSAFLSMTQDTAKQTLVSWLQDFGASTAQVSQIASLAESDTVTNLMQQVKIVVEDKIHAKGIPTLIYDGRKHNGLYR